METKLVRALGAFAIFFTLALPLFGALIAAATYTPLVNLVSRAGGTATNGLAAFYFNDFKVALAIPIAVGVAGAILAFLAWRSKNAAPAITLGRLLVIQTLAAFATFAWLAGFLVAAVKG